MAHREVARRRSGFSLMGWSESDFLALSFSHFSPKTPLTSGACPRRRAIQTSTRSAMRSASPTSLPEYRAALSAFILSNKSYS